MASNKRRLWRLICGLTLGCLTVGFDSAVRASTLTRPADPVVLTGADVASLTGIAPDDLVAFRYDGGWYQIPVQVDEQDMVNYNDVYNGNTNWGGGFTRLSYTDPGTFTGGDSDPTLDSDDEIVFMAKDAGAKPGTFTDPPGVIAESGVEVIISDPLDAGRGYVYLFQQDGALDASAGVQYVDYQFNLLSGDYLTTYVIGTGWNPEDSTVVTGYYERHFSDRWICDGLQVYAGGATGVDILDRHKTTGGAPYDCGRTTDTFSQGEGAFICNIDGPVRAIRSYVGCNSGPITQREHLYYEQREDIRTWYRVHERGTVCSDCFDYDVQAIGMTYYNNNNTGGVTIDGVQDTVTAARIEWEMVTGSQGSVLMSQDVETDITTGITITSFYLDDDDITSGDPVQCTGDEFAYGFSGTWVQGSSPNTDPRLGPYNILNLFRYIKYAAPGAAVSDVEDHVDLINHPLTYSAAVCRDEDGDGVMECDDKFPGNGAEWADDDDDGLGDNFEQEIIDFDEFDGYGTLLDVLPDDDFDGDGVSNFVEFQYRTDPTDPESHVPVSGVLGTVVLLAAVCTLIGRFLPRKVGNQN